jgi:hypothetical protein
MTEQNPHWPALPLEAWEPTRATLHMWTQIVGKIRLALSPYMNHWWQVPLYVTARGLTTSPIPYEGGTFEIVFDFIAHDLLIEKNDGTAKTLRLAPRSVAEFYVDVMAALRSLGIAVKIWTMPVEIPHPIPFDQDRTHASYAATAPVRRRLARPEPPHGPPPGGRSSHRKCSRRSGCSSAPTDDCGCAQRPQPRFRRGR